MAGPLLELSVQESEYQWERTAFSAGCEMAAGQGRLLRLAALVSPKSVLEMQILGSIADQLGQNLGNGAQAVQPRVPSGFSRTLKSESS